MSRLLLLVSLTMFTGLVAAACNGTEDRYTLQNTDTEVLDSSTNLVWKRCSEGLTGTACTGALSALNWSEALVGTGWRLANVKELASLLEPQCSPGPAINITMFPATPTAAYWTASPDRNVAANAWQVGFAAGSVSSAVKATTALVRLVKDAPQ